MPIDLQYLLWLQDLRAATGGIFDEFFIGLSKFAKRTRGRFNVSAIDDPVYHANTDPRKP